MRVLTGKVALVTGGTGGIGRASAVALAKAGANVVICGRREKEGAETVALIEQAGSKGVFVKADVSQAAEVEALVQQTVSTFGALHIAFNNAGIERGISPIAELTEEDFDQVFAINVKGLWLCLKYQIRQMLSQKTGGSIINNSSVQGHISWGSAGHYTASKHAVEGYTKTAALDYAKDGIRVNSVAPAMVNTEMMSNVLDCKDAATKFLLRRHPMGRFAEMDEVAKAVVFLASDASSYINGVSLPVDGGVLIG